MSINLKHQISPSFNEHNVSLAMIKILEEQRISNDDLRTMDRDDVEHLFQNSMGFTFRDRKQFWCAIQKIRTLTPKNDAIYIEQDDETPVVCNSPTVANQLSTCRLPPSYKHRVSPNVLPRTVEIPKSSIVIKQQNVFELSSSEEEDNTVQTATTSLPISTATSEINQKSNFQFVYPIELPTFSWRVNRAFETNNIESEWSIFIDELTAWILSKKSTALSKLEYQAIGRTVFKQYPNIATDGFRPWSRLCRCLTQRIRRIKSRQTDKQKTS